MKNLMKNKLSTDSGVVVTPAGGAVVPKVQHDIPVINHTPTGVELKK